MARSLRLARRRGSPPLLPCRVGARVRFLASSSEAAARDSGHALLAVKEKKKCLKNKHKSLSIDNFAA